MANIPLGNQTEMTANVVAGNGPVGQVNFTSDNPAIASVNPATDTTVAYTTTATAVSAGTTAVTAEGIIYGGAYCSDSSTINSLPTVAWWQAVGGNVHADGGGVTSLIPGSCSGACEPYLITQAGVGDTGLVSFNGSVSLGDGLGVNADGNDWQAETHYTGTQTGFAYFKRILSDDPAGIGVWNGSLPADSGVYLVEADVVTAGNWNVNSGDSYVLLADGAVTVGGNINVAQGGFLAIIASGDITVANSVTNVEGVLISDGVFSTGSGDQQLTAEGIFTGWGGVSLGRDLADNSTTPAELFVYRPDLQLNAYRYLLWLGIEWREVAP